MAWFKISGSDYAIKKSLRDINGRAKTTVRNNSKNFFVEIPESEQGWINKITTDLNLQILPTMEPTYGKAECGIFTANPQMHRLQCKKCLSIRGKEPTPRKKKNGSVKVLKEGIQIPDLEHFSINGLISLAKTRYDRCLQLAQEYDTISKALEKFESSEVAIKKIEEEKELHKKAIKRILEEEKVI